MHDNPENIPSDISNDKAKLEKLNREKHLKQLREREFIKRLSREKDIKNERYKHKNIDH